MLLGHVKAAWEVHEADAAVLSKLCMLTGTLVESGQVPFRAASAQAPASTPNRRSRGRAGSGSDGDADGDTGDGSGNGSDGAADDNSGEKDSQGAAGAGAGAGAGVVSDSAAKASSESSPPSLRRRPVGTVKVIIRYTLRAMAAFEDVREMQQWGCYLLLVRAT